MSTTLPRPALIVCFLVINYTTTHASIRPSSTRIQQHNYRDDDVGGVESDSTILSPLQEASSSENVLSTGGENAGLQPWRRFSRRAFQKVKHGVSDESADGGTLAPNSQLSNEEKGKHRREHQRLPQQLSHRRNEGSDVHSGLLRVPCSITAIPSAGNTLYDEDESDYTDCHHESDCGADPSDYESPLQRRIHYASQTPALGRSPPDDLPADKGKGSHYHTSLREASSITSLTAFIDTGAQVTVMSLEAARRANLTQHIDKRYAGQATGVGMMRIVGRIHEGVARITLGGSGGVVHISPAVHVLERIGTQNVDLLLGMDVLKDLRSSICLHRGMLTLRPERPEDRHPYFHGSMGGNARVEQEIDIPLCHQENDALRQSGEPRGKRVNVDERAYTSKDNDLTDIDRSIDNLDSGTRRRIDEAAPLKTRYNSCASVKRPFLPLTDGLHSSVEEDVNRLVASGGNEAERELTRDGNNNFDVHSKGGTPEEREHQFDDENGFDDEYDDDDCIDRVDLSGL